MKKFVKRIGILGGLAILAGIATAALMPWMDRWGAANTEIAAFYPGDELIQSIQIAP